MNVYLVTGATGYIGSMLVKTLLQQESDCKIIAIVRNSDKLTEIFDEIQNERIIPVLADITDYQLITILKDKMQEQGIWTIDYIYHCAAVTESAKMISMPVEVADGMVMGTVNILKIALEYKIKSMVYVSSMEVYGAINCETENRVCEETLGSVDLFQTRSCYPMGKRMAELYCYLYFHEYNVPVKIARLAQTFGKGVLATDHRVYMQFAKATYEKKDIVLHTTGESYGNYCSIDDAVEAIRFILMHGQNGEAYNVVNEENTMRIKEMAELVANQLADGVIQVVYDIPENNQYGYAANTYLKMSGKKLAELGFRPKKSLVEMYQDVKDVLDSK